MEENKEQKSIVKAIYGEDYDRANSVEAVEEKRQIDNKKTLIQKSRITVIFSITVLILSIYCLINLNPQSAEYVVCMFVVLLNVILISSVVFIGIFKKKK